MATLPTHPKPTLEQVFLDHLGHIKRTANYFCRSKGLSWQDTEEFVSLVQYKIFEDNYAILRKFQGKSSLETFLTTVVKRQFQDYLNHLWGKWRNSVEAKKLGSLATKLEVMLRRDGLSLNEACEILKANDLAAEVSVEDLAALAAKLPHRLPSRRMEGEVSLQNRPSGEMPPDQRVFSREMRERRSQILQFLKDAMRRLSPEDGLIASMSGEFTVSQIARALGLDQKALYRRREKIYKALRQDLEGQGVRPDEIGDILNEPKDDDEFEH
jgi:RNA polymerase sigma factor for flagellar operon FliA